MRDVGSKRNSVWAATRFDPRLLEYRSRATLRVLVVATAPRRLHILYLSVRNWTTSEEFFPEIRNDLTRDAQHDERGLLGFVDGR